MWSWDCRRSKYNQRFRSTSNWLNGEELQILSKKDFNETTNNLKNLNPSQIANNISSNLNIQIFEKQELIELTDLKRLEKIHSFIEKEISVLSVEKKYVEE